MPIVHNMVGSPTMNINGNVTAVWLPEWANVVLSGNELSDFNTAYSNQEALTANTISGGQLSITPTYIWVANSEVITGNLTQQLNIGVAYWTANNEIKTELLSQDVVQSLVSNGELATFTMDHYIKNSTVTNLTQIVYNVDPVSIPQDPQWLYYYNKFVSDTENVTFPPNWNTVTNT